MRDLNSIGAMILEALDKDDDTALLSLTQEFTPSEWKVIGEACYAYKAMKVTAGAEEGKESGAMTIEDKVKAVDDTVNAQESRVDAWLEALKASPHTARLMIIWGTIVLVGAFILGRCSV